MKTVQIWIIRLVKITIIIGIIQLAVFILLNNNINPIYIFNSRPVKGIFAHPNIYLVVILPFLFYFLKKHLYYWIPLVLLTCLGTGTRAPFLAILCMFIIIFKSFLRKKISWSNICVTLLIVAISYTLIIALYSEKQSTDFQDSNRFTLGTLQWRIEFWKNFLEINYDYSTFLGKGIGSADILSANLLDREISYPHSDYLRIYYDTGIIGLLLFLNLIRFFLCIIKKMIAPESDFILLTYLIIVCFYITDNFLYCTHSIFVYMFIASYLNFPSMSRSFNEDSINQ
jgi:O-antigen ligase